MRDADNEQELLDYIKEALIETEEFTDDWDFTSFEDANLLTKEIGMVLEFRGHTFEVEVLQRF